MIWRSLPKKSERYGLELLDLLRHRQIEALAEIGDAGSAIPCPSSRRCRALLDGRELAAQRGDLLVEDLDLRQRAGGNFLLAFELAGEFGGLALRRGGAGAGAVGEAFEFVAVALGGGERGAQLRQLVLQIGLAGLLHRQQIR